MDGEPREASGSGRFSVRAIPRYTAFAVGAAATLWLLQELRVVLQPVVLAVFVWFLMGAVARQFARIGRGPGAQPGGFSYLLSGLALAATVVVVVILFWNGVANLRENVPSYRENMANMLRPMAEAVGLSRLPRMEQLTQDMDLTNVLLGLLGSAAGQLGQFILIACIVVFVFAEARVFETKLRVIVGNGDRHREADAVFSEIGRKIETYLGVKCLIGVVQAVPTYVILALVGVDGPIIWAVFIFALSFIPTIGSLIGIALPSLLALIQFDSPVNFLITLACLAPVQVLASNWLEPRLTGSGLRLSPLAILISIFAGGAVWGIVGALISVPALTIAAIVLAQDKRTRPIAVILSRDGRPMG
ncbi:MAG: AI-2E family transporter [Pseudomonadota bacterium]